MIVREYHFIMCNRCGTSTYFIPQNKGGDAIE